MTARRVPALRPMLVGVAVFVIMVVRLLFPTAIGLADNGDGQRLMCHLGVAPGVHGDVDHTFGFAVLDYGEPGPATAQTVPRCLPYPSSTRVVMGAVEAVSGALHLQSAVDLRVLLVWYSLLTAVVAMALCRLVGGSWLRQGAMGAALLVVAGDSAFATYAGSPYTDTAALVGLLAMLPAAVVVCDTEVGWPARSAAAAVVTAAGALAVAAKVPTVTIAGPLVVFLVGQAFRSAHRPGRHGAAASRGGVLVRILVLAGVAVVLGSAFVTYRDNPKDFKLINATDTLFDGVLVHSDDPAADLAEMGLPRELARYAGSSWWAVHPPQDDPQFAAVESRVSYRTIARFLLRHPARVLTLGDAAAQDLLAARPSYLGNFQAGEAPPRAHERRLCVVSTITSASHGMGLVAVVPGYFLLAAAATSLVRRGGSTSRSRSFAGVALLLVAISVVQILTCAYGESIETTKHLVVALFAGALAVVLLLGALLCPPAHRRPVAAGPRR